MDAASVRWRIPAIGAARQIRCNVDKAMAAKLKLARAAPGRDSTSPRRMEQGWPDAVCATPLLPTHWCTRKERSASVSALNDGARRGRQYGALPGTQATFPQRSVASLHRREDAVLSSTAGKILRGTGAFGRCAEGLGHRLRMGLLRYAWFLRQCAEGSAATERSVRRVHTRLHVPACWPGVETCALRQGAVCY